MKYSNIEKAVFKERPNRFIAYVETEKGREICHVKNTGRCKELLVPEAEVYVQRNDNPTRKTKLDLIGVRKGNYLINMDCIYVLVVYRIENIVQFITRAIHDV